MDILEIIRKDIGKINPYLQREVTPRYIRSARNLLISSKPDAVNEFDSELLSYLDKNSREHFLEDVKNGSSILTSNVTYIVASELLNKYLERESEKKHKQTYQDIGLQMIIDGSQDNIGIFQLRHLVSISYAYSQMQKLNSQMNSVTVMEIDDGRSMLGFTKLRHDNKPEFIKNLRDLFGNEGAEVILERNHSATEGAILGVGNTMYDVNVDFSFEQSPDCATRVYDITWDYRLWDVILHKIKDIFTPYKDRRILKELLIEVEAEKTAAVKQSEVRLEQIYQEKEKTFAANQKVLESELKVRMGAVEMQEMGAEVVRITNHDIRNVLSKIGGNSQIVTLFGPDNLEKIDALETLVTTYMPKSNKTKAKQIIAEIREFDKENLQQEQLTENFVFEAAEILNGLNDFIRGEKITLEPKKFIDQIVEADSMQNIVKNYDAQIITADNEYKGKITINPSLIRRCLRNFMKNSLEAIELEGKKGTIEVGVKKVNDTLELYVQDDGPGVAEEIKDKMFELGTTFGKKDGHGEGLATLKSLARKQGCDVDFDREREEGSYFFLKIPLTNSN